MRQNGHLAGKNAAGVTEMTSSVDWRLTGELSAAAGKVASLLEAAAPLGVAFSGGVDSSVLLALAVRVLGADHVVAILGVSPSLGSDERLAAHQVAAFIGARLIEVQTREADNPAYRANEPDRCFTARGTQYGACSSQGFWGDRDAREVSLAGLRLRTTDRFTYEYAFFSNLQTWRHDVRVQAIEPARPRPRYAWCGGGARSAPPGGMRRTVRLHGPAPGAFPLADHRADGRAGSPPRGSRGNSPGLTVRSVLGEDAIEELPGCCTGRGPARSTGARSTRL